MTCQPRYNRDETESAARLKRSFRWISPADILSTANLLQKTFFQMLNIRGAQSSLTVATRVWAA